MTPSGQSVNQSVYMKLVLWYHCATLVKYRHLQFTKSLHAVASSDVMQTFCEACTYQNKMATLCSDNTKSDEMKIVFNCSAGVDGKDK